MLGLDGKRGVFANADERCPVEWMLLDLAQRSHRVLHRRESRSPCYHELVIILSHELTGTRIRDLPQASDQRFGSGDEECPTQAVDALPG